MENKNNLEQIHKEHYLDQYIHLLPQEARLKVAKDGYRLDILIKDKNWKIRCAVAEHGYGLDKLVHDNNYSIRCEVAKTCRA